ncbi:hypothetical protein [Bifidobacterium pseudocatenulatum]|uniref:Uncharacterized protein n=1 Tax=Bifidobacterium pseudocatenulatum TaxID=28026 RepID=A0A3E5HJJ5_BIFPS|nr:hypothetical protein [Bifidobacterium pseudocatenulatum]RGP01999.1 hypothetical protein DXA79_08205 [Bifidobacterium pseudocatenulatum]
MTIELVDGKAGTAHISSEDKAIIHQAKFSKSDVVFDWGDAFKCSMSSSNRATVGTGCASIQGLDWHITSAESVTISNGSQGMKRNDIICAHYNRNPKNGNELVELVVLKGSPNATAAADPTIPSGKILSGAVDAYMPLWRIPLDGITVGTPVRLFTPRGALWDSVTQTCQLTWQNTASFVPASYGASNTITVKDGLIFVDLSSFRSTVKVGDYRVWLFEAGVKPSKTIDLGCVANVAGAAYGKQARWNADGSVTLIGGVNSSDIVQCFPKIIPVPDGVEFV